MVASPGLVSFTRRRRASKGDEGRPEEPEAEQLGKQSCGNEAEATGSGAEAGESASQVETNPAGHGGRGRCGYAQKERRASEGDSEARGESRAQRAFGKVRDSGFAERTCIRGVSNEPLLAWDRSDLLRGPWEDSFEERRDPGASDGVLFSPERKSRVDWNGAGGRRTKICSPQ